MKSIARISPRARTRILLAMAFLTLAVGCGTASAPVPTSTPTPASSSGAAATIAAGSEAPIGHQVGERVPDFTIRLADGSVVTAAALTGQGQPAFLFFFATW